jgi:hypothetical protein
MSRRPKRTASTPPGPAEPTQKRSATKTDAKDTTTARADAKDKTAARAGAKDKNMAGADAKPRPVASARGNRGSRSSGSLARSRRRPEQLIEIDWRPFDDGRDAVRFEDLAVDLFVAEHGETAFTPNARRTGRDGGVDGLFDGTIDKIAGPWKIAVAVRQTFAEAKKKVRHENKLAREAGQRALFFITSFDATAVQTRDLKKLAKSGLKGAQVWPRAKLDRVLRDHVWLRQIYFGHQLVPGFVPLGHPSELDDPSQPDIEFVGRSTERALLQAFVEGTKRIAVIVAAGGSGKTRLLRGNRSGGLKSGSFRSVVSSRSATIAFVAQT